MNKRNTPNIDPWGIILIVAAIAAGIFVGSLLYSWETNTRAKAAASSPFASPQPASTASEPTKESPTQNEQNQPKIVETKPETKEPSSSDKETSTKPTTEVATPKPEAIATEKLPSTQVSFKQDVLPIFQKSCVMCHGTLGGLNLKDYNSLMTTGNNKPQLVPGKPQDSLLVKRLEQQPLMPPSGKLPSSDIQKIKQWITDGAADN